MSKKTIIPLYFGSNSSTYASRRTGDREVSGSIPVDASIFVCMFFFCFFFLFFLFVFTFLCVCSIRRQKAKENLTLLHMGKNLLVDLLG